MDPYTRGARVLLKKTRLGSKVNNGHSGTGKPIDTWHRITKDTPKHIFKRKRKCRELLIKNTEKKKFR